MRTFCYKMLHIPTGQRSSQCVKASSEAEFLKKLNQWNQNQPGVWQYWT